MPHPSLPPVRGGWVGLLVVATALALGLGATLTSSEPEPPGDDRLSTAEPNQIRPAPTPLPPAVDYLVWGHGGLPDGVVEALRDHPDLSDITVVSGDRLDVRRVVAADGTVVVDHEPGWAIPVDAQAFGDDYAPFASRASRGIIAQLPPGQVLIGETAASIRGVGPGAELTTTDGDVLEVAAVVPDEDIGFAEVALPASRPSGIVKPRYALARLDQPDDELQATLEEAAGERLRVKPTNTVRYRRHGDETLPPVVLKDRFGEFAFRDVPGRFFRAGASWVRPNIVTERVPILGRITCHRDAMPAIRAALQEVVDRGLSGLVNARTYGGCWAPRVIGASRTVSHHSWGVSIDLNVEGGDPFATVLDPRLVEIFEDHGFLWGGRFLRPDPAHFDYLGEAAP